MKTLFSLLGCIFLVAGVLVTLNSFTYTDPSSVLHQAFINSIQIKGILCFIACGIFWNLED